MYRLICYKYGKRIPFICICDSLIRAELAITELNNNSSGFKYEYEEVA